MFCQHCGASMEESAQFCATCGRSQSGAAPAGAIPGATYTAPAGVKAETGKWISAGWELVKQDALIWVLMTVVFMLLSGMVPIIIQGPLMAGMQIAVIRKMLQGRVDFADLFQGFNYFVPALVACLLITVFTFAGSLLCLIPGLVVAAMYKFTYLFIVDRKLDFWPAMQASHSIVKQDYVGFTLFLLMQVLINILGILCCFVGILITIPLTYASIVAAYRDIVGFQQPSQPAPAA